MVEKSLTELLKKQLQRERFARKEAERLLEEKSSQLYFANISLDKLNKELNIKIKDTSIELAKHRSRYFNLLQNAEDIITVSTLKGRLSYVNPVIKKILEIEPKDIIGQDYSKLVASEQRKEFIEFYQNQLKHKIPATYYEFAVRTKSDRIVWLGQRLIIVDAPDNKTEILGVLRDITNKRNREKVLESLTKELSEKADFLAAVNQFAVSVMDKQSVREITWEVSQNLIKTLRFEDCIIYLKSDDGKNLIQMSAFGDKAKNNNEILNPITIPIGQGISGFVAMSGKGEIIHDTSVDKRYIVDNKRRFSELTIPIISDGEVIGVIDSEHSQKNFFTRENFDFVTTIASLISDKIKNTLLLEKQRKAEKMVIEAGESIRKSEEKYRRVIENMNLGLMEVDNKGNILNPYKTFCEMTGYKADELIGRNAADIFLDKKNKSAMSENDSKRLTGEAGVYELEMIKKNGEKFWALISGAPIYGKSQEVTGSVGIHLDISAQKKLEVELQNAIKEKDRARDIEKEFLANMSHEIRNPLHSVIGMANLLYDTDLSLEQLNYVNNIKFSTDLLNSLVSDILDMSKIAEGKMELSLKPFNLEDAFYSLKKTIEFNLSSTDVVINSFFDFNIPDPLVSDPTYLNQILLNLLTNAVKFTRNGSIELEARLQERKDKNVWIEFLIKDTGIGIDEEQIKTIFYRFSQAGKVDESKRIGTGLGLTITQKLTELLGGSIAVTSIKGKGTSFRVVIPFQLLSKPISTKKIPPVPVVHDGINILIVEDNDINRHYIEKILEKNELPFTSSRNGFEAKEILKEQNFNLILMDIRMPIMDGYQTTIWLRNQNSNKNNKIPIIALTASALLDEKEKALKSGMNHHISKPFTPDTLLNAMQNLLSTVDYIPRDYKNIVLPNGIDKQEILQLYEGDWNHASVIFKIYLKNIPNELDQLKINLDRSDWKKVKSILHKIKPNFSMVGLGKIELQIQSIEELIKLNPFDEQLIRSELTHLFNTVKENNSIVKKAQIVLSDLVNA